MLRSIDICLMFFFLFPVPGYQALQFIAVRTVTLESILVEEAFGAATQANLIAVSGGAYGPAHPAMPTTPKQHGCPGQTGRHQAQRPQPSGALIFGLL